MSRDVLVAVQGDRHRSWMLPLGWYVTHVHSPYQHPAMSRPTTAHHWALRRRDLSISLAYGITREDLPANWDVLYRVIIEEENKRHNCPSCGRPRVYGTHYPCVPPATCPRCGNPLTAHAHGEGYCIDRFALPAGQTEEQP